MLQLFTYGLLAVAVGCVLTSICRMRDSRAFRIATDIIVVCILVPFAYYTFKGSEEFEFAFMFVATLVLVACVMFLGKLIIKERGKSSDCGQCKLAPSKPVCVLLAIVIVLAFSFRDRNAYHARIAMQRLAEMENDDVQSSRIWAALGLPFELGGGKNGVEFKQKERDITVFRKCRNVTFKLVADDAPVPIKNDFFDHKLVTIDKTDGSVYEAKYFRFYSGTNSVEECSRVIPSLLDLLERDLGRSFACRFAHRKLGPAQVKDELRYLFQFPSENTICEWQCDIDRYRITLSAGITENGRVLLLFKVKRSDGYEVSL